MFLAEWGARPYTCVAFSTAHSRFPLQRSQTTVISTFWNDGGSPRAFGGTVSSVLFCNKIHFLDLFIAERRLLHTSHPIRGLRVFEVFRNDTEDRVIIDFL